MTLPPGDIARISGWLAASGLAELELHGPDCHLRLRQDRGTVMPVEPPVAVHVVTAPGAGRFLAAHPLHAAPLAAEGTEVAAGQVIALLQVGSLLLPVTAPLAAIVASVCATPGEIVGYGTPLLELHPIAE